MSSGGRNVVAMEGQRFGALTVLRRAPRTYRNADWICRCDCGNECIKRGYKLRQGHVKSCAQAGCSWWNFVPMTSLRKLHPLEWSSWKHMLARCRAKRGKHARLYAQRGIKVCARWKSFENFLADMGPRPSRLHTIERVDNDGNYEPANCRWATVAEQNLNRRNTVFVDYEGERMKLFDVLEKLGVKKSVVYARLRLGWDIEDALTRPVRPKKPNRHKKQK